MESKGAKIAMIVILIIVVMLLIATVIIKLINKENKVTVFAIGNTTELLYEKKYDAQEINNILINASSRNIKFVEGNSNEVKVTIYGNKEEKYNISLEENSLKIEKANSHIYLISLFAWVRQEIIVELPNDYNGDIDIKLTSGKIEMIDLKNANAKIEVSSGNVNCGELNRAIINTTSGNISIGNAEDVILKATSGTIKTGKIKSAEIQASSGKIQIEEAESAKIKVTSGGIKIGKIGKIIAHTTSGSIKIGEITNQCMLSATSGTIQIEGCNLLEDSNIKVNSGTVKILRTNNIYIQGKSNSGSIKIEGSDRNSNIELNIETTSGSIKVNTDK